MQVLTLHELNSMVREVLDLSFDQPYWVTAEMSEMRVASNGHCYIELVEKGHRNTPVAKARAIVWANVFPMLRLTFEETTGQSFRAGLKVQLQVQVTFSEVYGYSLVVTDIDPVYTMGSLAQLRKEILEHLTHDGIVDMNKSLILPRPLQRIAVVSSATAAGYGDFCNQLDNNQSGYRFCHKLFPALMQGETAALSMIQALDQIALEADRWDAVVMIRGGGAVSDLVCFENYDLAACCAQFPLPVITGIGHERDTTVIDMVANLSLKTPTAVAAFLIESMDSEAEWLSGVEQTFAAHTSQILADHNQWLAQATARLHSKALGLRSVYEVRLQATYQRIARGALMRLAIQRDRLTDNGALASLAARQLEGTRRQLDYAAKALALYDPMKILRMGYSITRHNGKAVNDLDSVKPGDTIVTTTAHGEIQSTITCKHINYG